MRTKLLALVVGMQVLWVTGAALWQEWGLEAGERVVLQTTPVDPRDLLRGDYVVLNYAISRVSRDRFEPALPAALGTGATVWVVLEREGAFHTAVRASTVRPLPGPGQVAVRGRVQADEGGEVRVAYGLERYYVREGTGNPSGRLTVEASVDPRGVARIVEVYVDGVPYGEAMKPRTGQVPASARPATEVL